MRCQLPQSDLDAISRPLSPTVTPIQDELDIPLFPSRAADAHSAIIDRVCVAMWARRAKVEMDAMRGPPFDNAGDLTRHLKRIMPR